jgi:hypothetical protein
MSAKGVKFDFFIGMFFESSNPREILNWTLLRDLSELQISLDLDMYETDDDSDG